MINAEDAMDGRTVRIKHLEDVNAQLLAACEAANDRVCDYCAFDPEQSCPAGCVAVALTAAIAAAKGEVPE